MTLCQLKIFAVVAKYLNVTKASQQLYVSQSSISQRLKSLQEECGMKLYNKVSRGIELTEDGRQFLQEIEPRLRQIESLKQEINRNVKNMKGDRPELRRTG